MHTRSALAVLSVLFAALGFAGISFAHESGHITIGEEEAIGKGTEVVTLLVKRGKIEKSWGAAVLDKAELKVTGPRQWHLVYRNGATAEPEKDRLFVFLTADGQLLGANFTGEAR